MKNECVKTEGLLSAYADNELAKKEMTEVSEHLAGCSDCSGKLKTLNKIKVILKSKKVVAPTPFLENRIVTAIAGLSSRQGLPWKLPLGNWRSIPLFAAVSIFMIVLIGQFNNTPVKLSPVEEYIYDTMTVDNSLLLQDESLITRDDVFNMLLNL